VTGSIVPEQTTLTEPYWAAAREGRVALQRCVECGIVWHPPSPVCPAGRAHPIEWFLASGHGRLYSYTEVQHAAHPAVQHALPYLVGLIDLAEGPRLVCNLVGADTSAPAAGAPVTIGIGPAAGGLHLPVARLVPGRADPGDAADRARPA
jgi:uncharacterized OB-fold protein